MVSRVSNNSKFVATDGRRFTFRIYPPTRHVRRFAAVAENGHEAAGSSEKAIGGPRREDGAFAELARQVKAEDAGRVVVEDEIW